MIALATTLNRLGLRQSAMARDLGVSRSSLNSLLRHGRPCGRLSDAAVRAWLAEHGATAAECDSWACVLPDAGGAKPAPPPAGGSAEGESEDTEMLIAAQNLEEDELEKLGLVRNPFRDDIRAHADVFLSTAQRRVREAMWQAAQHKLLIAVVGESGSGKTVLRRDVIARALSEDTAVVPIMPYTLGMEASEQRGQGLRATDIAEMIIRRLEPKVSLRASRQGRYHQAEAVLAARVAAGQKPVLIIEEAHRMSKATLRHLKGFAELELGYAGMLGIILIGQTELADTLSETDPTIREVVQRFQVLRLAPLEDVGAYLRHKFARAGADLDAIAEPDALTAIQERLSGCRGQRKGGEAGAVRSLCYPLASQNLLVIALKAALQVGRFTRLTRDHVEAV